MNNFFKEISKLYLKNKTKTKTNKNKKTKKTTEKPEALIMVETDSLSFVLSCCSIPFYIIGLIGNVLVIRIVHKTREMHTPTNYLLASMAVSDVFTIVTIAAQRFAFIPNAFSQEFDRINHVRSGCVGQRDSIINLAWKIHLIVFNALFLIRSVVMVFCYGSLIRGLYFTNSLPRKWNRWWREKLGEEETWYHIPSSDSRVFDRLYTLCGFPHCCCISDQPEYRYQPVLSSPECVSFYV